jgi:hypothetical protein
MPVIDRYFKTHPKSVPNEAQNIQKGTFACAIPANQQNQRPKLSVDISKTAKILDLDSRNHRPAFLFSLTISRVTLGDLADAHLTSYSKTNLPILMTGFSPFRAGEIARE